MKHRKNDFNPEEILADLATPDPDTVQRPEQPAWGKTLRLFLLSALALVSVFGYRSYQLTVLQQASLFEAAEASRARVFLIPPNRGAIISEDGMVLAENEPAFALIYDPLLARTVAPEARDAAVRDAAAIAEIDPGPLFERIAVHADLAEPLVLLPQIAQRQAVEIAARLQGQPVRVLPAATRTYRGDSDAFSMIIGYLGAITKEELQNREGYVLNDAIGKAGIERSYETVLRGRAGERRIPVDASGRQRSDPAVEAPVAGSTLRLSINAALSEVTAAALRGGMSRTRATGASAVVLDARSGAVRAMISLPSFSSSTLSGGTDAKTYAALVNDPRNPFLNRAVAGVYPSGSTVKPFVGAAALSHGVITAAERIDASKGSITVYSVYDPSISWTFDDWTAHGFVNMTEAIARSSNVYFYTVGGGFEARKGLGIDRLVEALRAFGFGSASGIDLPGEATGRVPTPQWKEETIGEAWFIGDTYNLSIGQGNFGVTPLQLATATAAVANGGTLYRPYVLDAVLATDGSVAEQKEPSVLSVVPFDASALETVRKGMRIAVTAPYGTNRSLAGLPIAAAAKTGTAQFGNEGKTHAIVTAFAPYDDPEIAIAVVLEGGGNSPEATRVAKEILEWYATQTR